MFRAKDLPREVSNREFKQGGRQRDDDQSQLVKISYCKKKIVVYYPSCEVIIKLYDSTEFH